MLRKEENDLLTSVGPGTIMGAFMRLHWIPALLSAALETSGPAKRIRLLGEDLLAFRNSDGNVGIVEPACPHRGAPLFYARNEACGIRCVYHGWKFSNDGTCLDIPTEPSDSTLKEVVRLKSYLAKERNGVIWVYMGDGKPSELPSLEWNLVPAAQRHLSLRIQECNWLQALEGEIDTAHAPILHGRIDQEGRSLLARQTVLNTVSNPRLKVKDCDYGVAIASERASANIGVHYWRINQFLFPFYTLVPPFDGDLSGHAWVPIDDNLTLCFMFSYHPSEPLEEKRLNIYKNGYNGRDSGHPSENSLVKRRGQPYEDYWTKYTRANDYNLDWVEQTTKRFSGLPGLWVQDAACQSGIQPIQDRSREMLGDSDLGIARTRATLLRAARAYAKTGTLPATATDSGVYAIRAIAINLNATDNWETMLGTLGVAKGRLTYSSPTEVAAA